jgi:alpha-ribazole phosphatase
VRGGDGRCYGRLDLPLADADCSSLVAALSPMRGARIWASPLTRCRLVAESLAEAWRQPPPRLDARLLELHFGAWEGRLWDDVPRPALDLWAQDLRGFAPSGGESGAALVARVTGFWQALDGAAHVVITHGGPLKVFAALAEQASVDLSRPAPAMGSIHYVER